MTANHSAGQPEKDGEAVVRSIEESFGDVPYPGDNRIMYSITNPEALRYQADFNGRHWSEVIEPGFLRQHNVFLLFSLEGLRFYLPAYLIGAIRYPADSLEWVAPVFEVLYPSLPSEPWHADWRADAMRRWDELMHVLTPAQKHSIRIWFEYLADVRPDIWSDPDPPGNSIQRALANYWNQF